MTHHFNRSIALSLLLMGSLITAYAQSSQRGVVLEYNERQQKTPLGGVEILVVNAGSTTSAADGQFQLGFRTLKPGDKVIVRRIEKEGYELFNRDALDQWVISRNTDERFTIVMCRSERFKQLRDNYYKVASESYARQMEKERQQLAALRREGKLKEKEYKAQLEELKAEYEERLDNLDNYIDRFARIDLNELSDTESGIIEMVQQGDIEGAIKAYENLQLEQQYRQAVERLRQTEHARDTIGTLKAEHEAYRDSLKNTMERRDSLKNTMERRDSLTLKQQQP